MSTNEQTEQATRPPGNYPWPSDELIELVRQVRERMRAEGFISVEVGLYAIGAHTTPGAIDCPDADLYGSPECVIAEILFDGIKVFGRAAPEARDAYLAALEAETAEVSS